MLGGFMLADSACIVFKTNGAGDGASAHKGVYTDACHPERSEGSPLGFYPRNLNIPDGLCARSHPPADGKVREDNIFAYGLASFSCRGGNLPPKNRKGR